MTTRGTYWWKIICAGYLSILPEDICGSWAKHHKQINDTRFREPMGGHLGWVSVPAREESSDGGHDVGIRQFLESKFNLYV